MPRRIPDEKREEIIRLYDNGGGMSPAEIARQTGVSYSSVYGLTKVRQRVNPETGEPFESKSQYQEYTARQRVNPETGEPFESLSQLMDYQARQRVNPETGEPFESLSQLMDYQTRQRVNPETGEPFESESQYQEYTARQRVNPETGEPFESLSQYQEYTARQRVNRPENQGLSDLINRRLKELRRNQAWLAEEMGVTRQAVSLYVKGRSTPTNDLLQRLYSSLDVPYETLDDLLEDLNIG